MLCCLHSLLLQESTSWSLKNVLLKMNPLKSKIIFQPFIPTLLMQLSLEKHASTNKGPRNCSSLYFFQTIFPLQISCDFICHAVKCILLPKKPKYTLRMCYFATAFEKSSSIAVPNEISIQYLTTNLAFIGFGCLWMPLDESLNIAILVILNQSTFIKSFLSSSI